MSLAAGAALIAGRFFTLAALTGLVLVAAAILRDILRGWDR